MTNEPKRGYEAFGLRGRVALVTGGSKNIGRGIALACVFLASELAGFITGQELCVTGGAWPLVRQPADEYPAEEF